MQWFTEPRAPLRPPPVLACQGAAGRECILEPCPLPVVGSHGGTAGGNPAHSSSTLPHVWVDWPPAPQSPPCRSWGALKVTAASHGWLLNVLAELWAVGQPRCMGRGFALSSCAGLDVALCWACCKLALDKVVASCWSPGLPDGKRPMQQAVGKVVSKETPLLGSSYKKPQECRVSISTKPAMWSSITQMGGLSTSCSFGVTQQCHCLTC